jgi:hypothetical protein
VIVQDPVWEQSFPPIGSVCVPLADPASGRVSMVRLTRREAQERRGANEARLEARLAEFEALDLPPILLSTSDPDDVLRAFLEWAAKREHLPVVA